jgi:hypothetical protein
MPGGTLAIRQRASGDLVQSGPAERVFSARVDLDDLGGPVPADVAAAGEAAKRRSDDPGEVADRAG